MFILNRRNFLQITGAGAAAALMPKSAFAAIGSSQVFTSDANSALVDSTVLMGEESAVLIDAQFTVPAATQLADIIEATGRRLETIFITHGHPDHYLGLEVFANRFPEAKILAHPQVKQVIEERAQGSLDYFNSTAPAGVFASEIVLPEPLEQDHVMLEGDRINILEPMNGDTALICPVHVPSLDLLIAADVVFADTFVWTEENTDSATINLWRKSLDTLEAIGATTIIPGHQIEGSSQDASNVEHTRRYLDQWEAALATTSTAAELDAAMRLGNENLQLEFCLERGVAAIYPNG
ncbi:MAG: MBL fold metallo-hydrolase [Alphaproteobacteria bacterium]